MKNFLIALQFLSRIKLVKNLEISEDDFGSCGIYFPLVGFFVGGILAVLAYAGNLYFYQFTTVAIIITGEILITGGLHLDGYMDSCDGLFSGKSREKMLEIMKDSRIGSMGVLGIIILVMIKSALLLELSFPEYIQVLLVMPLLGRWSMVFLIFWFPYARDEGLGAFFRNKIDKKSFILTTVYSSIIILLILPVRLYAAVVIAVISTLYVSFKINKILKGHTGDTYGMINEISEVFLLFWCVIFSKLV